MNTVWLSVSLVTCISTVFTFAALLLFLVQILNLLTTADSSLYFSLFEGVNISIVFYLISLSIVSAWGTNFILKKIVEHSKPLSLENIEFYLQIAKDVGLIVENKGDNESKTIDSQSTEEKIQLVQDELQCELELLLNELHRLLIASWYDSVSPLDPDFPRATRQAFARASVDIQGRAGTINPNEAAKIILTLIISHFRNLQKQNYSRMTLLDNGSAAKILADISEALVSTLLPTEMSAPPGGTLLASLLAHGALCRALALVSDPGWLSMHLAQLISGESLQPKTIDITLDADVHPMESETAALGPDTLSCDMDMDSVQEACTPSDDTPDLLPWPNELGSSPKLWGTCSLQPEQPSLPQIVEPNETVVHQTTRKACEAEWLNPSPPRQHLGLQLSKSSLDLSQVSVSYARDNGLNEDMRSIKFSTLTTPTSNKETSLGSYVRGETSFFGSKVREAGSDVLGSLRAKASNFSALLSPARDTAPPPPTPLLPEPLEDEDDSVSPVYEEASDLASSIAKLRVLLQNRDHKSSTEEEDLIIQAAEDSEEQANHNKTPPMWERQTEGDNNSDSEWMEAEEAPELPDDGRPFMNIIIPATELSCDASGQQFVQYCIQYDAVYVQEGEEGPRLVLQTTSVKRRFQEFLNLQNRLEESPIHRSALRAVKGPSRWLSLAFSKAGQQTTAARLPVLERFLQQLCEQPVLARSPALRHFLAYGSQRAMAFTKQGSDMPRLDKILARTVSGVFHSIKTALPSFDFELSPATSVQQLQASNQIDEELERTSSLPSFLGLSRAQPRTNQPLVFMEKPSQQSKDVCRDIHKFLAARVEPAREAWSEDPTSSRKVSLAFPAMTTTGPLHAAQIIASEKQTDDHTGHPLTKLLEDLLAVLLPECWLVAGPLPHALRSLLQQWTEHKLQDVATRMWSLQSAVCCLRLCRAALAPDATVLHASKQEGQAALKSALHNNIPGWLKFLLGASSVQKFETLVTEAVSQESANQELALNIALSATYLMLATQPKQQISPITYC